MSLLLTVVVNIQGVNCDTKTDFPKSGHNYIAGVLLQNDLGSHHIHNDYFIRKSSTALHLQGMDTNMLN